MTMQGRSYSSFLNKEMKIIVVGVDSFGERNIGKVVTVTLPGGTRGVHVPPNPALAITHRFAELEKN